MYKLADYGTYIKNSQTMAYHKILRLIKDLETSASEGQWAYEILHATNCTILIADQEGKLVPNNLKYYRGYIIGWTAAIFFIETDMTMTYNDPFGPNGGALPFMSINALNSVIGDFMTFNEFISNNIRDDYNSYFNWIIILFSISGFVVIILSLISLKQIWNIRQKFNTIFMSYKDISKKELSKIILNLENFNKKMASFKENMCAVDPVTLKTTESSNKRREQVEEDAKNKRKEVNFHSQFHFYGLLSSSVNILAFYTI